MQTHGTILLESGPARYDRLYWLAVGIAFLAFGGWLIWDGAYGYREDNRAAAEKELPRYTTAQPPYTLPETPTPDQVENLRKQVDDLRRTGAPPEKLRETVRNTLGQSPLPPRQQDDKPVERFASIYGMATAVYDPRGPVEIQWTTWKHKPEDIRLQFLWAVLPIALAFYPAWRAYKAWNLHAVIDEQGMTYGGLRIPFDDVVSLRDYNRKGWVDLYYRVGESEKRLRIDNQKIARFDEIAEVISRKKGWPNPVAAARQAEDAEAEGAADEAAGVAGEAPPEGAPEAAAPDAADLPAERAERK